MSTWQLAREVDGALSWSGLRCRYIQNTASGPNAMNHPYPYAPTDKLPLQISTPFRTASLPAKPVDANTLVLCVQKDGGEQWGEEHPCHDTLLVLRRKPGDPCFREVANYWVGKEQGLCGNEWSSVKDLSTDSSGTVTLRWWASFSRYSCGLNNYVSTFSVRGDEIACMGTRVEGTHVDVATRLRSP